MNNLCQHSADVWAPLHKDVFIVESAQKDSTQMNEWNRSLHLETGSIKVTIQNTRLAGHNEDSVQAYYDYYGNHCVQKYDIWSVFQEFLQTWNLS